MKYNCSPKYLKDIVRYQYMTGSKEMQIHYNLTPHWHGPFECDVEDFKKFYAEITKLDPLGSGEVTKLYLIMKSGLWLWRQGIGWEFLGR